MFSTIVSLPEYNREPFVGPRRIWMCLSEWDRKQWAAWVEQQSAPELATG